MAQQSQKISNRGEFKRIVLRGILYTVVIPVLVIAVIVGGIYLKSAIEASNAQASMKEYLQKKYGQEFVVERPEHRGGGFMVEGHMSAVAYPKDDSTLKFEVKKSSSDTWDGYADKVWSTNEANRIRPEIDKIMTQPGYEYEIEIGSYLARSSIKAPLPSLSDLINKHGENILYTLRMKSNTPDKIANYDRIILLLQMLKEKGSDIRFIYTWTENKENHRVSLGKKDIDKILNGSVEIKDMDRIE